MSRSSTIQRFSQPARARRAWLGLLVFLPLFAACGPPPAQTPIPQRPIDPARASVVIINAFRAEGDTPAPTREVALAPDKMLKVDVSAQGKKYGVAYVTPSEAQQLGSALPSRTPAMGDALQLVTGIGKDADARILVLRSNDYTYDDLAGPEHENTAIAAEQKLTRDVRDFLVRAHAENWP